MKSPATSLLRGLAAGVLSASLTTGCAMNITPTAQAGEPYEPRREYDWVQIAPMRPTEAPSPSLAVTPEPIATSLPVTRPRPSKTVIPIGVARLNGQATWYRWRVGEAAAGPLLRQALGKGWRGRVVTVCMATCVRVRLTDWCLCRDRRVVDLDHRSFQQLAPLSRGVIAVTVRW